MANVLQTPVTILKIIYMNEKFYRVYWVYNSYQVSIMSSKYLALGGQQAISWTIDDLID